jgi:glycosyltransferase involved in cell wall biosynthesis
VMPMNITCLIPTYNRPILLERALFSVLQQNYENVVVHIGDNSSDEESMTVANSFASKLAIKYFKHRTNIGSSQNFRFLHDSVSTTYYHFLSDDDMLAPNFYIELGNLSSRDHDSSFFCFRTLVVSLPSARCSVLSADWQAGEYEPSTETVRKLAISHFCSAGVIFNKKKIASNPLICDPAGSDQAAIIRLACMHPFTVSQSIGAIFFVYDHNMRWSSKLAISDGAHILEGQLSRLLGLSSMDSAIKEAEIQVAKLYAKIFISLINDDLDSQAKSRMRQKNRICLGLGRYYAFARRRVRFLLGKIGFARYFDQHELLRLGSPEAAWDILSRKIAGYR